MFEQHVTSKIQTLIEPQGGARDPDRRLDPDPGYAFQGVKNSRVPELNGMAGLNANAKSVKNAPGQLTTSLLQITSTASNTRRISEEREETPQQF